MEVKNPQVAVLCNHEVFTLLKKTQENSKVLGTMNHSTILYEVNKYLEQRPCATQNADKIKEYLITLKNMPINLTKKEKLMLVNDPPDSVLQLSLGIKDFYDKLSESDTELLLKASKQYAGLMETNVDLDNVQKQVDSDDDNNDEYK